jgi:hypothetical protein
MRDYCECTTLLSRFLEQCGEICERSAKIAAERDIPLPYLDALFTAYEFTWVLDRLDHWQGGLMRSIIYAWLRSSRTNIVS